MYRILARGRTQDEALFSSGTVTALRRIGWTFIVGTAAAYVVGTCAQSVMSHLVVTDGPTLAPVRFSLVTLIVGLGTLAVSEVVDRGLALLEDVKATI